MTKIQKLLRELPKVDEVLLNEQLFLCKDIARPVIVDMVRDIIAKAREEILSGEREEELSIEEVVEVTLAKVKKVKKKLRRIINATGVILHTNLGRSVLSTKAQEAIIEVASSYSNLEYNLDLGARGSRHDIVEHIVKKITNSQSCMVVNNNAAATMLVLASMAKGKEVIISRGELVEIGGSFRIPDVMQESGGILKEVGATNKTRLADYKNAFDEERTAAILKVHTSNYRIVGFTEEAELKELVELGKTLKTPVIYDMGSGLISSMQRYGINEPTVSDALDMGADVVLFSGDKLLGGPQAGIIIGKKKYIDMMKKHPLARAFRVDKFTLAALEATLTSYLDINDAIKEIPTLNMIAISKKELYNKADTLKTMLSTAHESLTCEIEECIDQVGGGSAPTDRLEGFGVSVRDEKISPEKLERRLRKAEIPIIARINHDRLFLDVRTIKNSEFEEVVRGFKYALEGGQDA